MQNMQLAVTVNPFTRDTYIEARLSGEVDCVEIRPDNLHDCTEPIILFGIEYIVEFIYIESFKVYIKPDTSEESSSEGMKLTLKLKLKE
jgi:hypothetical protein